MQVGGGGSPVCMWELVSTLWSNAGGTIDMKLYSKIFPLYRASLLVLAPKQTLHRTLLSEQSKKKRPVNASGSLCERGSVPQIASRWTQSSFCVTWGKGGGVKWPTKWRTGRGCVLAEASLKTLSVLDLLWGWGLGGRPDQAETWEDGSRLPVCVSDKTCRVDPCTKTPCGRRQCMWSTWAWMFQG